MNIKQLDDLKDKNAKPGDEKKKRQTYVGGEKSGLAVEDDNDVVSKVVATARNNSDSRGNSQPSNPDAAKLIITLYADGFIVSDVNVLRPYSDPQNQKFMSELSQGFVPDELRSKYPSGLEVALQDNRTKSYKPQTAPAPVFFQGEGQSISGLNQPALTKPVDTKALENFSVPIIPGEAAHELQLKFPSGERKIIQVYPSTPFSQVRDSVQHALKTKNIKITTPFPIKDITGEKLTIKELDLLDSSVNVAIV